MNEQSPDHDPTGSGHEDLVWMPTRDAAKVYGITQRSVRKWRDAGKVQGRMINGMWYIGVTRRDIDKSGENIEDLETEYGETIDGFPAGTLVLRPHEEETGSTPVDLGPMADLIADLNRQVAELSATAGMLQERNRTLEEQRNSATLAIESGQSDHQREIDELQARIDQARQDGRTEADAEWRSKSWWKRIKGE